MNKRLIPIIVVALVVALGATLLFYRLMASRMKTEAPKPVAAQVVLAARDLPVGTLVKDPDIKVENWPGPIPPTAVSKREDVLGRGVISQIMQGELFLEARLAPKGAGAGLAAIIPKGMRAVAVRVNDVAGVAGFVVPGSRVDILVAGTAPNVPPNLGELTKTLLQNVEVLSAGQNIQKDAEGKPILVPVVNMLVTPEQAEVLSLASNSARVQFVLRNPLDTTATKTPGTAVAHLFSGGSGIPRAGGDGPREPRHYAPRIVERPAPRPTPLVVEVYQGPRKTDSKFDQNPEASR